MSDIGLEHWLIAFAIVLPIFYLVLHVPTIIKFKGYRNYFRALRVLYKFKKIDCKVGYTANVTYNFTGTGNFRHHSSQTVQSTCVSIFYFMDSDKYLECDYVDELYSFLYLDIVEGEPDGKGNWNKKEYKCHKVTDIIYAYFYYRLVRKIKKAKMIEAVDVKDCNAIINNVRIRENRKDSLEILLD